MNNNALLRLQVRIQTAWTRLRDSERAQAVVEYVGVAFVVVAIIGMIVYVISGDTGKGIGESLVGKLTNAINKVEFGRSGGN